MSKLEMGGHAPMIDYLWQVQSQGKAMAAARFLAVSFLGSLFVALAAQLSIPFYPVPVTGQTFGVFAVGLLLGRDKGTAAILMYLAEGMAGFPVFANAAFGIAPFLGPTGGYLLGFIPAAFICGCFSDKGWDKHPGRLALVFALANLAVFVPGLLWLGFIIGWDKPVLELGLYPFITGDLLKLAVITAALPVAWKVLGKRESGQSSDPQS